MYQWHGPIDARFAVVLAPGDHGRFDDAASSRIAAGLASAGLRVCRFESQDREDPSDHDEWLTRQIQLAAMECGTHRPLILAGISRGARVSAQLVDVVGAVALLAFAYPFHGRTNPDTGRRVQDLASVRAPVMLCQGTRDAHGNREQIRGYALPDSVRVHWLEDANHALCPRPRSGFAQASQLDEAVRLAVSFVHEQLSKPGPTVRD